MRGFALALLAALAACGGHAKAPETPAAPLHLEPIADLLPAAGLVWLVDARPSAIAAHAELVPAIRAIVPDERFTSFAQHNGGLDLRTMNELAIARYGASTLFLAKEPLDPSRVESAFTEHLASVDGRALDHASTRAAEQIVRTWGKTGAAENESLAILGTGGAALERGKSGPLRATELFAEGRLKKASPALRAVPLLRVTELLGDAPLRMFAPGPFKNEWAYGLGGLLRATTAVGISVKIPQPRPGASEDGRLDVSIVLLGGWKDDAPAAGERLSAAFDALANDPLGKLTGVNKPLAGPTVRTVKEGDAIRIDVSLDGNALAKGLRIAALAPIDEVMSYGSDFAKK